MIAIIDYDAGNIRSVEKALNYLGEEAVITRDCNELLCAEKVILPGVGAFKDAMHNIRKYDLEKVILEIVERKTPFLGICLGLQLLFESSEENPGIDGLGLLKGEILRIPEVNQIKIPHMGWNSLEFPRSGKLFQGVEADSFVYFVHSYYLSAKDSSIVTATTEYGTKIHASVEQDNLFACQFHPEKSSATGLKILNNFVEIGREVDR